MQFLQLSTIFFAALLQQSSAAPITEDSALAPRAGSPGLYVCVHENFQGVCKHYLPPSFNYCCELSWPGTACRLVCNVTKHVLQIDTFEYGAFYRTISSAGADQGTVCKFYSCVPSTDLCSFVPSRATDEA